MSGLMTIIKVGFSLFVFANVPLISNFSPKGYFHSVNNNNKNP